MLNINSGEDYGRVLVEILREGEDDMPQTLIEYWCSEVMEAAIDSYNEYISGRRDDFQLTEQELEQCYENAGLQYTEELLNEMLDKDFIKASINAAGSVVYSKATKKRKKKDL